MGGRNKMAAAIAPNIVARMPGPNPPYHAASANAEKKNKKGASFSRTGFPKILSASATIKARIEAPYFSAGDLRRISTCLLFKTVAIEKRYMAEAEIANPAQKYIFAQEQSETWRYSRPAHVPGPV